MGKAICSECGEAISDFPDNEDGVCARCYLKRFETKRWREEHEYHNGRKR